MKQLDSDPDDSGEPNSATNVGFLFRRPFLATLVFSIVGSAVISVALVAALHANWQAGVLAFLGILVFGLVANFAQFVMSQIVTKVFGGASIESRITEKIDRESSEFEDVAAAVEGEVEYSPERWGGFAPPNPVGIHFEHRGMRGQLFRSTVGHGEDGYELTCIQIELPDSCTTQLQIVPETIGDNIRKIFGTQDIEIGDSNFDFRFKIQGDDPVRMKHVLNDRVREEIQEIDNWTDQLCGDWFTNSTMGLELVLDGRGFFTAVRGLTQSSEQLLEYRRRICELYDAIVESDIATDS